MGRGIIRRRDDDDEDDNDPLFMDQFNPRARQYSPNAVWRYYFLEHRLSELGEWRRRYHPTNPRCDYCMIFNLFCNVPQGCAQCLAVNRPCTGAPTPAALAHPQPKQHHLFGHPVKLDHGIFDDIPIDPRLLDDPNYQPPPRPQPPQPPQPQPQPYSQPWTQTFVGQGSSFPVVPGGSQSSYLGGLVGTVFDRNRPDASSYTLPPAGGFQGGFNQMPDPVPGPSFAPVSGPTPGYTPAPAPNSNFFPDLIPSYNPAADPGYFPPPPPAPAPAHYHPPQFTHNPAPPPIAGPSNVNRDDEFITPEIRARLPADWVNGWPPGIRPPQVDRAGNPITECDACRLDRPGYPCDAWSGVSPGVGCTYCKKGDRSCRWGDVRLAPRPDGITEPLSCDRCVRTDILGCSWRNRPTGAPYAPCTTCVAAGEPCTHGSQGDRPGLRPDQLLGSDHTHFTVTCYLAGNFSRRPAASRERQSNQARSFNIEGPRVRSPGQIRTRPVPPAGSQPTTPTFDNTTRRLNLSGRRTDGGQQCMLCASRVSQGHTRANSRRCNADPSIPRGCDQCSSWGVQCVVDGAALPPTVHLTAGTLRDQAHYSHCEACNRNGRPCDRKRPCDCCVIFGVACRDISARGTFHRGVPGDDQPLYYLRTGFGDGGVYTLPPSRGNRPALPMDYHLQYRPSNGLSGVGLGYVDENRRPLTIPQPPPGQQVDYPIVPYVPQALPPNVPVAPVAPDVPGQQGSPFAAPAPAPAPAPHTPIAQQGGIPIYSPLNVANPVQESPGFNPVPSPSNDPSPYPSSPLDPAQPNPFDESVFDLPFSPPNWGSPVPEPSGDQQNLPEYQSPSNIFQQSPGDQQNLPEYQSPSNIFQSSPVPAPPMPGPPLQPPSPVQSAVAGHEMSEEEYQVMMSAWTNYNAMVDEPSPQTGGDPQPQPDNPQQQTGDHSAPSPASSSGDTEYFSLFGSPVNQPASLPTWDPQPASPLALQLPAPSSPDDVNTNGFPGELANFESDGSLWGSPQSQASSSPSPGGTQQTTRFFALRESDTSFGGFTIPPESTAQPTIPGQAELALPLPPLPGIDRQQQVELWTRLIAADNDQQDVAAHNAITDGQLIDERLGVVDSAEEYAALGQPSHVAGYGVVWRAAQRLVRDYYQIIDLQTIRRRLRMEMLARIPAEQSLVVTLLKQFLEGRHTAAMQAHIEQVPVNLNYPNLLIQHVSQMNPGNWPLIYITPEPNRRPASPGPNRPVFYDLGTDPVLIDEPEPRPTKESGIINRELLVRPRPPHPNPTARPVLAYMPFDRMFPGGALTAEKTMECLMHRDGAPCRRPTRLVCEDTRHSAPLPVCLDCEMESRRRFAYGITVQVEQLRAFACAECLDGPAVLAATYNRTGQRVYARGPNANGIDPACPSASLGLSNVGGFVGRLGYLSGCFCITKMLGRVCCTPHRLEYHIHMERNIRAMEEYLQQTYGRTSVCPFCRVRPGIDAYDFTGPKGGEGKNKVWVCKACHDVVYYPAGEPASVGNWDGLKYMCGVFPPGTSSSNSSPVAGPSGTQ
ncbi:hypothetical protein F5Y00DRAFT_271061 [Daldinia vernicosa]|uniref:uncharacterized protein n=1 Tax=Daldinia vernicosa TaxID=114800 RepID=UPI002008C5E3|nr:uncharacterized protein F5Y00DRAFT_271061 [Daldinia vernicosa]KAI0847506.1 hypothetical protein F5Y00DRAFT_271061 [Daldinia vernicosa]